MPKEKLYFLNLVKNFPLHVISVVNIHVLRFKNNFFLFLPGKPVAVTSNRGTGRAPLRPGANPQLEWQYYQNKILKGKAGTNELSLKS